MKQNTINLKNYIENNFEIVDNYNFRSKILNGIFIAFGVFSLSYIFILGNLVLNIIERKNIELEAREVSTTIAGLELSYISLSNNVLDGDLLKLQGFKEVKPIFATRKAPSVANKGDSSRLAQNEI